MNEQIRTTVSNMVSYATELGADHSKCVGSTSISLRLIVENGEFSLANSTTSQGIGIAVLKDQKKGSYSTNSLDEKDWRQAATTAMTLASFSLPDPFLDYPGKDLGQTAKPLDFLYHEDTASLSLQDLGHIMEESLAEFHKEPRLALDRFEMSSHLSYETLVNSKGIEQQESQTTVHWSYLGMARDQDEVSGMDYDGGFSFSSKDCQSLVKSQTSEFIDNVLRLLKPTKCPAYKGPVLIAPRAMDDLLLSTLLYHASGRSVMDGKSRWDKSIGEQVISPKITITDTPHDQSLIGATSYDSDGLPTKSYPIFENGVLKTHLHDCYSARKTGAQPTATAGGPFSMVIKPGDQTSQALREAAPNVLYVTRFSGNVDPLTGDFSGLAKSSRLFKNGKDLGPVGETMIAGNVFEMANQIIGLSDKPKNVSGHFSCPDILVDGISVS